ncbi:Protein CUP-SHAPED COTYLEDON [Orobanche gracilis]
MENISSNNNYTSIVISNLQSHASLSTGGTLYYPPGYRFVPTDKELIIGYLRKKVNNEPIPLGEIREVNLYNFPPKYLTENYSPVGEKEWYFFTMRDRRYPKGNRPKRSVGGGIGWWKATGGDKLIRSNGKIVGKKQVLVFYYGKNKSGEEKTNWIMHEYKLDTPTTPSCNNTRLDDWVLCRIYERNNKKTKDVDDDDDVDQVNNNLVVSQPNYEDNNNIGYVQPLQIQNDNINVGINQNHNNHYDQGQGPKTMTVADGYGENLHQVPAYYNYEDGLHQVLSSLMYGSGHSNDSNNFLWDYEIPCDPEEVYFSNVEDFFQQSSRALV